MQKNKNKKSWNFEIDLSSVKDTDILLFTKHLSVALKAGLTLIDGLEMLYDQATGKMKKMLAEIIEIIKSGQPFHKALANYPQYFSPVYLNLVKSGEYSGTLESNLNHLSENLRKNHELKQKIKSAMMYPLFVLVAVVGLAFSVSIFVLPKIIPLFKSLKVELSITTRVLIFVADAFAKHGFLITAVTFLAVIFIGWLLRKPFVQPVTHRFLLIMPILKSIVRNVNLARFTRTLGTLLASGITLDVGLQITIDSTGNRVYRNAILSLIPEVQKGKPFSDVLAYYPNLFPVLVSRMIAMGEKTGSLDKTLNYLSDFYEGEVDTTVRNLSNILEPFLLIVIGVVVGTVAVAILGPIYQITGSLRK